MTEAAIKAAEKRGYSKGYAARIRRVDKRNAASMRAFMREEFERQVFVAILPELVARPWRTGEKNWTTMDQFIGGAREFASKAATQFNFPLPPSDEGTDSQ
jgi:hypothetical protein